MLSQRVTSALITGAVLLTGAQTSSGSKTWTGVANFIRTAQAGVAEAVATFGTSDDSNGRFTIGNATSGNGQFIPNFTFASPSNTGLAAWICNANGLIAAGADPIIDFRVSAAGAAPSTRDLFTIRRGGSERVWTLGAFGNTTTTVAAQAGVGEVLAACTTTDAGGGLLQIQNGSSTDSNVAPTIYAQHTNGVPLQSALGLVGHCLAADDTGPNPLVRIQGGRTGAASLVNRPILGLYNLTDLVAAVGANGGLTFHAAGAGLAVKEGTNCKQGVATLSGGTVTVANTRVTANSRIFLTPQDNNTTGAVRVSARVAGTSFTITSNNAGDTGVVAYEIFEPS